MELASTNSERIILVTGTTGGQGGVVYQQLRKKGFKLRALVRDSDSSEAGQVIGYAEKVFQGSFDDPDWPRPLRQDSLSGLL